MDQNKETRNKVVQTYAEDMAQVLQDDKEGLVKKIIHGAEEHEEEKMNSSPESKKNKFFMLISILLTALAFGILFFFLTNKIEKTVPAEKQFTSIIFNDKTSFLEVGGFKKSEIEQTVLREVNATDVKQGGLHGIYLTENKQIVGLRRFITLIKSSFTPSENTLFVSDNFLMGTVKAETNAFFMLLKVRSTLDIFESLRTWEEYMLADLRGFFGITISAENNYLLRETFEDSIVENKNARVLYDKEGNIVLMYIFANENSVVFANSLPVAHEVMLRIVAEENK